MTAPNTTVGLTETEALALIASVQLAVTLTDQVLIQNDAIDAAKRIQESLAHNPTLYNYVNVAWEVLEKKNY